MMREGLSVITQKFVQTGNLDFSEDIQAHRKIMGIPLQPADILHITAPVIFSFPASPELAARLDHSTIDFKVIEDATNTLADQYDHVLIEGAGGLMVPLKGDYLTIDYIRDHNLPLVLVTNSSLGSINHTLLSLAAIASHHIDLFAVVYNPFFDKEKEIADDTREFIRHWLESRFPDTYFIEMP